MAVNQKAVKVLNKVLEAGFTDEKAIAAIRLSTLNSSALTGFSLMRAIFIRICTSTPRCGM